MRAKGPFAIRAEVTNYGFNFGSVEVTRLFSRPEDGYVVIGITTPKGSLQVYASRTGKIRIFKAGKEMK